jgi:hypothetical protein
MTKHTKNAKCIKTWMATPNTAKSISLYSFDREAKQTRSQIPHMRIPALAWLVATHNPATQSHCTAFRCFPGRFTSQV